MASTVPRASSARNSRRHTGIPAFAAEQANPAERVSQAEQAISRIWNGRYTSDAEIRRYIHCGSLPNPAKIYTDHPQARGQTENARRADASSLSQYDDMDCGSWQDAPNSKCHASFGDQGTTATVGAFGQLLQFSDFTGAGSSGMFSVDHAGVDEPYQVRGRAWELHARSQQPFHFRYGPIPQFEPPYGLRFPGLVLRHGTRPRLQWTHWRWPRYEYHAGCFEGHPNLKLTIQWMVHEKILLQQCLLENDADDVELSVEFSTSMMIRDLDHVDGVSSFNKEDKKNHDNGPGPGGYSWVCVHKLPGEEQNSNAPAVASNSRHGISVVCSVAINGEVQLFKSTRSAQSWTLPGNNEQMREADNQRHAVEVITAYKMQLVDIMNLDWKTQVIPWDRMNVSQFILGGETVRTRTERIPTNPPVGTPGTISPPKIPGAPHNHLIFAARRNLEHILSVCAVQTTLGAPDDTVAHSLPHALRGSKLRAVALTCGDMSGHRICWSASL